VGHHTLATGITMTLPAIAPAEEAGHRPAALAIPAPLRAEHDEIHQHSLRAEWPRMLEEHKGIHAATARLAEVARLESNAEVEDLAMTLAAHAEAEEQLFYPAAVLVGEIVRSRAASHDH
jgi:hypothetical protein